jgi:hypothetical protein
MLVVKLISDLSDNPYIILDKNNLNLFLSQVKVLKEENTYLNDFIRILNFNDIICIQETSDKNEIIIRRMNSLKEAEDFVKDRLDFYERKWDGCGCKIDYYS